MGLVLNKARRETVSYCIFGAAMLVILASLGFYIYLPISQLIQSGKFISLEKLYPLNKKLLTPFPAIAFSVLLFIISSKLKKEETWIARTYERLGPGTLLLILLFIVWFILPLINAAMSLFFL